MSIAIFSAALTLAAILLLRRLAPHLGLVDKPGGRKNHKAPTPSVGGIAIVLAAVLTGALAGLPPLLIAALLAAAVLGGVDDRLDLSQTLRLSIHLAIGAVVVHVAWPEGAPALTLLGVTVPGLLVHAGMAVFVAAMINGVNWIDGIDGLAGVLFVISLGFLLLLPGALPPGAEMLGLALIGGLFAFLSVNLRVWPRKSALVFMGDAGSTFFGAVLAYLILARTGQMEALPPVTALVLGGVFLADMVVVMTLRPLRHGRKPWDCGDHTHVHHRLMGRGHGVNATVGIVASAHLALLGLGTQLVLLPGVVPGWSEATLSASLLALGAMTLLLNRPRLPATRPQTEGQATN